jgi:integrase
MASLECDRVGNYLVRFRWGGKPFKRSLGTKELEAAQAGIVRVDETLLRLKRGYVSMPPDAEPGLFIVSGGMLTAKPVVSEVNKAHMPTLGELVNQYLTDPPASIEPQTMKSDRSRLRNLKRLIGEDRSLAAIDLQAAHRYAKQRLAETRSGKKPKPYTVSKELKTLCYVWRWAVTQKHVPCPPTWKPGDVALPKEEDAGEWLTFSEIKTRLDRGGLSSREQLALWSRLYLTDRDLLDLLDHVKSQEADPWVYPAVAFAALTGARRSEIARSEIYDFHLEANRVVIREKKRDTRRSITFRSVDLHPTLAEVMGTWFKRHRGGRFTLCQDDGSSIDVDMMDNRLESCLRGSKWQVLKGWHVFRHSFISILASHGVDQRVIDSFVGHQTEDMRRRYRHLFPTTLRSAILMLLPS